MEKTKSLDNYKIRILTLIIPLIITISCNQSLKTSGQTSRTKQEFTAQKPCTCLDGIGSIKGDKPILHSIFSNGQSTVLCGFYPEEMQDLGLHMIEFNIFDCDTGKALVQYGALQTCRIKEAKDRIVIEELTYLPAGANWLWTYIQIGEQVVYLDHEHVVASARKPKLQNIVIPTDKQNEFLHSIAKDEIGDHWEDEIGKLELLSLLGNKRAWHILQNYEDFKGSQTDGAIAEQWKDAIANVNWILNE